MITIKPPPKSCDTFVALPPASSGCIIFGKNSDRPDDEAQPVVAFPGAIHPTGSTLKCTYITIPQAPTTHAVILSKPQWMWGAEMAANDAGVVIGNEAVRTNEPDGSEALLGMDLVRLAAERCSTAESAVDTIVSLLEEFGQGGGCEEGGDWSYHNSYLIADNKEACVLETAGRWWAAERVTSGLRNISNCLSIRTNIDKCSNGLLEYAQETGKWDGTGSFDWAKAFSSGPVPPLGHKSGGREATGLRLMQQEAAGFKGEGVFTIASMVDILTNCRSGICMTGGGFRTNGSQVSVLYPPGSTISRKTVHTHWFTGTPDPSKSVFKPISFPPLVEDRAAWAQKINSGAVELWNAADRIQGREKEAGKKFLSDILRHIKNVAGIASRDESQLPELYHKLAARERVVYAELE